MHDVAGQVDGQDTIEVHLLRKLGECYNLMDFGCLQQLLADEAVYESQISIEPVIGKGPIIERLNEKAKTIRSNIDKGILSSQVRAEVAVLPDINSTLGELDLVDGNSGTSLTITRARVGLMISPNKPCLIIYQGNPLQKVMLIMVKESKGLIERMDLCTAIPPVDSAIGSGVYPGLDYQSRSKQPGANEPSSVITAEFDHVAESRIQPHVEWRSCDGNGLSKRFYCPGYSGFLPFFFEPEEYAEAKKSGRLILTEKQLLFGILMSILRCEESPDDPWSSGEAYTVMKQLMPVLGNGFGIDSMERVILSSSAYMREKNWRERSIRILQGGLRIIPWSSPIMSDLVAELYDWAQENPEDQKDISITALNLISRINRNEILDDANTMLDEMMKDLQLFQSKR